MVSTAVFLHPEVPDPSRGKGPLVSVTSQGNHAPNCDVINVPLPSRWPRPFRAGARRVPPRPPYARCGRGGRGSTSAIAGAAAPRAQLRTGTGPTPPPPGTEPHGRPAAASRGRGEAAGAASALSAARPETSGPRRHLPGGSRQGPGGAGRVWEGLWPGQGCGSPGFPRAVAGVAGIGGSFAWK